MPMYSLPQMDHVSSRIGKFPAKLQVSFLKLAGAEVKFIAEYRRGERPIVRDQWFHVGRVYYRIQGADIGIKIIDIGIASQYQLTAVLRHAQRIPPFTAGSRRGTCRYLLRRLRSYSGRLRLSRGAGRGLNWCDSRARGWCRCCSAGCQYQNCYDQETENS